MTKTAKEVAYFLNTRPLCFLSTVFGVRDIIVGLALFFGREWDRTVLYSNLNELGGAWLYGIILAVVSLFVVVTAVADQTKYTKVGLRAMSWFWLFATFSYLLDGYFIFGAGALLLSSIPAGYIAFYYKHTPIWDEPKRQWRTRYGLSTR